MPSVPSDEEFLAYNQGVISEFRANHGVVSQPPFPVLLLSTTGARTGRRATVPLRVRGEHRPGLPCHRPRRRPRPCLIVIPGTTARPRIQGQNRFGSQPSSGRRISYRPAPPYATPTGKLPPE